MSWNLAVLLRASAQEHPTHTVVIDGDRAITYAALDEWSDRLAAGLIRHSVQPSDRIILQLPNIAEFPAYLYAILKVGAVAILANPLNKAAELGSIMEHADARVLVSHAATAGEAVRATAGRDGTSVFVVGASHAPRGARLADELERESATTDPFVSREPGDTAVLLYTSGTTGKPKGVKLTHFQLYMNAQAHRDVFAMNTGTVTLAVVPLCHALGLSGLLNATTLAGGTVVLLAKFDPAKLLEAIGKHHVSVLHGVPTMYYALLHHPGAAGYDTSSLTYCGSAGSPMAADLMDRFERQFGLVVLEMYGLTESGPLATCNLPEHRKSGSVGTPIWATEIQIWDANNNPLPPGNKNIGEIVIRGHNTMAGYLDDDAATAEAFAGGWLHSGDLGYRDEDGFLFIAGRKKELIIRGGYNVYPQEVEAVLRSHPAVSEAAVVGVPDERLGEEVRAYVSLRPGANATEQEIIDFVKDRVAAYKYPRSVVFVDDIPKNSEGKILKRELTK
jgi:long-chain acyl-CoA synthetase